MFIALKDNRRYVIRFDKDEEVIAGLQDFMAQNHITACAFYGVGAVSSIEMGYYNNHLKDYRRKPYVEDLEIISYMGNGGMMDGKPIVHAHGMFGRTDFTTIGGHVFKLVVSATCEVFLIQMEGELKRANNPDFNLSLLI